jgi:hypothetical protein
MGAYFWDMNINKRNICGLQQENQHIYLDDPKSAAGKV